MLTSTYVGKAIKCPAPPDTTLDNYTWAELKEIAQLKLTASQYESRYGIKLGQKKDGKYVLVDLDGNDYGGFVFMYDTGLSEKMNSSMSNYGGYRSSALLSKVNNLYTNMTDTELKNAIKQVTIKTSSPSGSTLVTNNYSCYMFLASYIEVGGTDALNDANEGSGLRAEGRIFDFFQNNDNRLYVCHRDWWWTRSVDPDSGYAAFRAVTNEGQPSGYANPSYAKAVVATFVIG